MKRRRAYLAAFVALATMMVLPIVSADAQTAGVTFRVTTTTDTVDAVPGDGTCADATGLCSLRAAVQEANATPGSDAVRLESDMTYALTISGAGEDDAATGDLDISDDLFIRGRNATIELVGLGDRAFDVMADVTVQVDRLTIVNGAPPEGESGGAIQSAGTLSLDRFAADNNTVSGAGASGGALFNNGGTMDVKRAALSNNTAVRAGGAIEANAGTTTLYRTSMTGNTAGPTPGNGGALHLTGAGVVDLNRSDVVGNSAASEGGGLWNSAGGTMTVSRSKIEGNDATGEAADNGGGGLFNDGGSLTLINSRVVDNSAIVGSGSGGGILNNDGTLALSETVVLGNEAARAGGGIEVIDGLTTIDFSKVLSNETGPVPGNGGGVHVTGGLAIVTVSESAVNSNIAASEGGGLWAGGGNSTMTVTNSMVSRNVALGTDADNGGGGLFNNGGVLTVNGSTLKKNTATEGSGSGGGILNLGSLDVDGTLIIANRAARAGGGIESNDVNGAGNATLNDVELTRNRTGAAPGNGGGMHVTGSSITTVITDSSITLNRAANEGGGLWNFAGATMTVTSSVIVDNLAPFGPNVFQQGDGGNFTIDGTLVPPTLTASVTLVASVDGAQANGGAGTASTKTATVIFTMNPDGTIDVDSTDDGGAFIDGDGSVTAMHIHGPAAAPANAGVVANLGSLIAPTMDFSGTISLDQMVIDQIAADPDLYYINVHTSAEGGGEIRGQLAELPV